MVNPAENNERTTYMKTSEKLRRKIKQELPEITIIDDVKFYGRRASDDGVAFTWLALAGAMKPIIYSYDTMAACLEKPLSCRYTEELGSSPEGWLVGID